MSRTWQVPILVFHHVSPEIEDYTNTPPMVLAEQLDRIAERFQFWTISDAWDAFLSGREAAGRILLTFDDGYEDNSLYALPILATRGIRATFFVLSDYVGRLDDWNGRTAWRSRHMNKAQLRELVALGHEIGSHGRSHRRLTDLPQREVEDEVKISRTRIEQEVGVSVQGFAYPYGQADAAVCHCAATQYRMAFSTVKSAERDWWRCRHNLRRSFLPASMTGDAILRKVAEEEAL